MIVHVVRSVPPTDGEGRRTEPPDVRPEIDAIIAEFRGALGELRCVGSERMVKEGVSTTNLHVLSILGHHGTLTMSRLAELLDVSLSNATGLVDRMEERGWVGRERDREDRRVVIVRLAEGGRRKLSDIQLVKEDLIEKVLLRLDPEVLHCVRLALRALREAALDVAADPSLASHWHVHAEPPAH